LGEDRGVASDENKEGEKVIFYEDYVDEMCEGAAWPY
jgi:hypothetical protein